MFVLGKYYRVWGEAMRTDSGRWQFVLHFAQLDLDALRPSGWLKLREDLAWFLTGSVAGRVYYAGDTPLPGDIEIRPFEPPSPLEYPEEAFRALQHEIIPLVQSMVGAAHPGMGAGPRLPFQAVLCAPSLDGLIPETGQHLLIVEGSTRDAFILRVFALMVRDSTTRLRRCPECNVIFYRMGKQQYCSRPCVNRATVRTWRERAEVETAHAGRPQPRRSARSHKRVATRA
jgi:hypothetical protein